MVVVGGRWRRPLARRTARTSVSDRPQKQHAVSPPELHSLLCPRHSSQPSTVLPHLFPERFKKIVFFATAEE